MTTKNRNYRAAVSAVALFAAVQSNTVKADTTQDVTLPAYSGTDYDILFPTVFNATDLVSISDGSVYTGEGSSLIISAIDTSDHLFTLYSSGTLSPFDTKPLSFFTNNNFTLLPAPTDIKGLRIATPGGNQSASLAFLAGTILTFAVVPEPATALLVALSLLLLPLLWRKFRRPVEADQ